MGEIVNLNRARKAKKRAADMANAAINDAAHARTKGEKDASEAEAARRDHLLDGAKRED